MKISPLISELVITKLCDLKRNNEDFLPLHAPSFGASEMEYVTETIKSEWVSTAGSYVNKFEEYLAEFTNAKHCVAVSSGTAALHICLISSGVKPGHEVLLPSFTFVATANAVSYANAVPHFVDIEERFLGIDASKLDCYLERSTEMHDGKCINKQTKRQIASLILMHTFGNPSDITPILKVCEKYQIKTIEDGAESLGSKYNSKHSGTFAECAALSFNGNKIITTGGGGAILTDNSEIAELAKHLTTTAKLAHPWEYKHDHIGFNYRLPNINAALGVAQLEKLSSFLKAKKKINKYYKRLFLDIDEVMVYQCPEICDSNYWLNCLILKENNYLILEKIIKGANEIGIMTRPAWTPLHKLKMYAHVPRMDLFTTESLSQRVLNVPSSPSLVV